MKRAIKNRRSGMTLVELIVGFALVAILSAALVGVISPVYRTYQRTRAVSDAEALAGNMIDTLRTSANSASTLSAAGNDVIVGVIRYYVSAQGRLMYEVVGAGEPGKSVFDEKYYDGKTIELRASQPNPAVNTVRVTVSVHTADGVTVSQTGVISTLRQYISGSHSEKADDGTVGGGGNGIQDDGTGTDWAMMIAEALKKSPKGNTQMNVDSAAPTLSAADAKKYNFGNWSSQVMLALAKLLFPENVSVTTEEAALKLAEAHIATWAIRNHGSENYVFLSGLNIQALSENDEVPVIYLNLKNKKYLVGYAKVHVMQYAGKLKLTTPYKTLGDGEKALADSFSAYQLNGVNSYSSYESAREAYNKMPLAKP